MLATAPTGVAARNVLGFTLHSVFKLPVQREYEQKCHTLNNAALKELRQFLYGIHTIVIDEMSMVSVKTFHSIHERLCAIADNSEPFGGFNILLFEDFFQLRPVR